MVLVILKEVKLLKVCHQVLKQELKNGILIQKYLKYQMLVLEQLKAAFIPGETIQATESTFFSVGLTTVEQLVSQQQ